VIKVVMAEEHQVRLFDFSGSDGTGWIPVISGPRVEKDNLPVTRFELHEGVTQPPNVPRHQFFSLFCRKPTFPKNSVSFGAVLTACR
jgi:hypothetical protein